MVAAEAQRAQRIRRGKRCLCDLCVSAVKDPLKTVRRAALGTPYGAIKLCAVAFHLCAACHFSKAVANSRSISSITSPPSWPIMWWRIIRLAASENRDSPVSMG